MGTGSLNLDNPGRSEVGKEYDIEEQDKVEQAFAPLIVEFLQGYFGREVKDVRHLHLEYDFIVDNITLDLKADTIMATSGNFFIETESVKNVKKGWFYNKNTDWILYLDTVNKYLYMLDLKKLQSLDVTRYLYHEVKQKRAAYLTCGYLVPINVVCEWTGAKAIDLKLGVRKTESIKNQILEKVREGFMLTEYWFVKADDVEVKGEWAILKNVVEVGIGEGNRINYVHRQDKMGIRVKDLKFT